MHNADALAPHSKAELPAVVAKLFAAVPAQQRGGREQCLYVFAAGDTFIFEYKAFQAEGGAERKVLLWLMLRGGQLRRLTFKGLSEDSREFEQGRLSWGQKTAFWEGEEKIELEVLFRCK